VSPSPARRSSAPTFSRCSPARSDRAAGPRPRRAVARAGTLAGRDRGTARGPDEGHPGGADAARRGPGAGRGPVRPAAPARGSPVGGARTPPEGGRAAGPRPGNRVHQLEMSLERGSQSRETSDGRVAELAARAGAERGRPGRWSAPFGHAAGGHRRGQRSGRHPGRARAGLEAELATARAAAQHTEHEAGGACAAAPGRRRSGRGIRVACEELRSAIPTGGRECGASLAGLRQALALLLAEAPWRPRRPAGLRGRPLRRGDEELDIPAFGSAYQEPGGRADLAEVTTIRTRARPTTWPVTPPGGSRAKRPGASGSGWATGAPCTSSWTAGCRSSTAT